MEQKLMKMLIKSIDDNMENRGLDIELSKDFDKNFFNVDEEAKKENISAYVAGTFLDSHMFLYTFLSMLKNNEIEISFKENASKKSIDYLNKLEEGCISDRHITVINGTNKEDYLCIFSRVYATGKAEELLGYDLVCFNKEDFKYMVDYTLKNNKHIFNGYIYDKDFKKHNCNIYLWQEKNNHKKGYINENFYAGFMGLVVLKDDLENINNAKIKYEEEVQVL